MSTVEANSTSTVSMQRHWLAPNRPCLPQAAEWLLDSGFRSEMSSPHASLAEQWCDLRSVVCVTPGGRSNRLLEQCLLDACHERGRRLLPPRCVTPGVMIDELFPVTGAQPRATQTEVIHAWTLALQRVDRELLKPLLPEPTHLDDLLARHDLARTIAGLHDELAGEQMSFSHIAQTTESMERFTEADRWRALHAVYEQYRIVLEETNLADPHTARSEALRHPPPTDRHLVLIGVVDLNAQQRAAVQAIGERAHVLIHTDQADADLFDEYGCVNTEAWRAQPVAIDDDQIIIADRPADQAQAVFRRLAEFDSQYATNAITIGLGNEALADPITLAGQAVKVTMHNAAGEAMSCTRPFRLLQALADWLQEQTFARFATLLRHPDIEQWLSSDLRSTLPDTNQAIENWITLLDEYYSQHLQGRLTGQWLGDEKQTRPLAAVWDAMQRLCDPLAGEAQSLGQWAPLILAVLQTVYAQHEHEHRDTARLIDSLRTIRETFGTWREMPDALQPRVEATTALRLALRELTNQRLASPVRRDQIEMLGWLELHLDTAPALIVTGFNDGDIPSAVHGDAFLPNSLRERLGLMNNSRRYARDAYLLRSILQSREEVTLIAGRRRADDEPATPSRLLFACDEQTLLARIKRVCRDETRQTNERMIGWPQPVDISRFDVPPLPDDIEPPTSMNVTDFKLYIQCPYRYALQRLVRLQPVEDAANEMDPLVFGQMAHEVLERFGRDASINTNDDPDQIEQYLFDMLDALARDRFGTSPLTSVRVQLDALQQRLRGFAAWQAQERAKGWTIQHCEWRINGVPLDIPGETPMPLHAKIDRIDINETSGDVRIIDYKTGDNARSPHHAHHGRTKLPKQDELEWQDLQLPLYHHLYQQQSTDDGEAIHIGYLVLPRNINEVGFLEGEWDSSHIQNGVETARAIVLAIRRGEFEMNTEYESSFDRFARLCQTGTFSIAADADADAGENDG